MKLDDLIFVAQSYPIESMIVLFVTIIAAGLYVTKARLIL